MGGFKPQRKIKGKVATGLIVFGSVKTIPKYTTNPKDIIGPYPGQGIDRGKVAEIRGWVEHMGEKGGVVQIRNFLGFSCQD